MILHCIRHGQTLSNAAGKIQGQSDTPLSPLGRQQCQATAAALSRHAIDAVYSSPLSRALDSARVIADRLGLEPLLDDRLMEIHAGIFQGFDWSQIADAHPEEAKRWRSHDPDYRIPGGESRRDLMHRAGEVFNFLRESGYAQIVVVSHGGLLSAALKVLLEIPAQRNPFSLMNGSITTFAWTEQVKLLTYNQTSHLAGLEGNGGDL